MEPLLSPNNFTEGHLMKKEWLVANATPAMSPDRAERGILGMMVGVFLAIQAVFVVGEPFCYVGTPS